jgi:hypothetical protein
MDSVENALKTASRYWPTGTMPPRILSQYIHSAGQKKWMFGEKITPELVQRVSRLFSNPGDSTREEPSVASVPRQGIIDYEATTSTRFRFHPRRSSTRGRAVGRFREPRKRARVGSGAREFLGLESLGN